METTPILEVRNVVKKYEAHTALNKVSISILPQTIFGLLGPNGAGKTSLIRLITQITAADEGEIYFCGEKLQPKHTSQIGYLPEERGLYKKMKIGEQLLYLAQLKDLSYNEAKKRIRYWLEKLDLMAWWDKNIEDLSKGMQQKVQFIATVITEPKLLILDEPFSGFDPVNSNVIRDEILELRQKGCTIIFSTHRMDNVEEMCDYLTIINKAQKIIDGKKTDIKNQFKTNTFVLVTEKPLLNLPQTFALLQQEQLPDSTFSQHIKLQTAVTHDLLSWAISQSSVYAFHEHTPTIHEIFVNLVQQTKA
jgi:ABC-2 type transport system ATP-binding protein